MDNPFYLALTWVLFYYPFVNRVLTIYSKKYERRVNKGLTDGLQRVNKLRWWYEPIKNPS